MGEHDTIVEDGQEVATEPVNVTVKKPCPECGKLFKPSGLTGHLRFAHDYSNKKASVASRGAPVDEVSKVDKVFQLIEKIDKVRERIKSVDKNKRREFFTTDEASEAAMAVLAEEEKRLTREIKRMQGKPKADIFQRLLGEKDEGSNEEED